MSQQSVANAIFQGRLMCNISDEDRGRITNLRNWFRGNLTIRALFQRLLVSVPFGIGLYIL